MSVTIFEDVKSRNFSVDAKGAEMPTRWVCFGSDDEIEVYNAIRLNTPTYTTSGLIRTRIGKADFRGSGLCYVEVMYGAGEGNPNNAVPVGETPDDFTPPPAPDTSQNIAQSAGGQWQTNQSFTTSGGTAHITQSLETRHKVKATSLGGGVAADNQQAIGLKRDGVEGCEIVVPKLEFSYQQDRASVSFDDMRNWMLKTGRINNALWKGFKKGEVLFLGAEGQSGAFGRWTVTFRFAFNDDMTAGDPDLVISRVAGVADITLPSKEGWDYAWTAYKDQIAGTEVYPLPIAGYVERVYKYANFGGIGIGA